MSQPHRWSMIESAVNVTVGYALALVGQLIVYPLMGIPVTFKQNLLIGAIFLLIGLTRAYLLRRFFNWLHLIQYNVGHAWKGIWKRLSGIF